MCGIAGLVGRSDRNKAVAVRKMLRSLERRGPDGEGIEVWGEAVLGHRRLAIIDLSDRLGVKPLLYAVRDGRLAFASTARALRVAGLVDEIDEKAFAEYLEFGFVTDDRSIYRGAFKVPAASIVDWSEGTLRTREYWSLPDVDRGCKLSFDEAVEETERLLLESVEIRLRSDVAVGALLSGGVDSSLVCWAVAKLGADVTAYTVGTPGDQWDETKDASETAARLSITHRVLPLSATDAPDVSELVSAYGEPFACASALGMLGVSRAVAASAKVLLTGDGGDDVFLGYPRIRDPRPTLDHRAVARSS